MISNRCAIKSLLTNCNSIISKNYLRFLVNSNDIDILMYNDSLRNYLVIKLKDTELMPDISAN